jgi:nucleoside-diphosphate-sugar epimerase
MAMRVAVVGATGVLGRHVVPRLQERGHDVRAIVQDEGRAAGLRRLGVDAVIGDILDAESLRRALHGCEAVLHLATRIPKNDGAADWSENDRIRRDGTRHLLEAAAANGVGRYVQQSIVMLYGDRGAAIVDESVALEPQAFIQSALEMEQQVHACALHWSILRGGYFYGPGTSMEDGWRKAARDGTLRIPGDDAARISLIHVADMARAVLLATESAAGGSIYNVVDDQPVTYAELYRWVAAQIGAADPPLGGPTLRPSLACSNARIKRELGWLAAYPTFRAGLA